MNITTTETSKGIERFTHEYDAKGGTREHGMTSITVKHFDKDSSPAFTSADIHIAKDATHFDVSVFPDFVTVKLGGLQTVLYLTKDQALLLADALTEVTG